MTLMTMCGRAQGLFGKGTARIHVTHIYHVYDDAPHAVPHAGKGTDAEGWLNEAVAFWEEQSAEKEMLSETQDMHRSSL